MSTDIPSGDGAWLNTSKSSEESDKSTIPSGLFSSPSFSSSFSSSSRMGWDKDAPIEGVATKSGRVRGVPSGMGIPSGTTNPS